MTTKTQILQTAFPESLFNVRDPATGRPNVVRMEQQIRNTIDAFSNSIDIPQIPSLPTSGVLRSLIPSITPIELPSPAEIREFVDVKIREAKRRMQEQTISQSILVATAENKPFTARQYATNIELRKNSRG